MAVPTTRTDLSATAGSNSPAGSDTISGAAGIDEYLRALSAFIRQNYDDILLKSTYASPTFTGTVVLPSTTSIGNVSATEISYLDGVTSSIQTQINNIVVGGGTYQPLDSDLTAIAALTPTDNAVIIGNGTAWVAESGATLKTSLGLTIGTNVQAYSARLTDVAALSPTDSNFIVGNGTTWVVESGTTVRSSLGLGTLATASTINNSNWSGTALAIANGGTGATSAGAALTALGAQAASSKLTDIAALAVTDSNIIVGNGTTWVAESGATARTSLGAQASSSKLTDIAALAVTDGGVIVGNGTTFVLETGNTLRSTLAHVIEPTWAERNTNFNAAVNTAYMVVANSVTVTLPSSPLGEWVKVFVRPGITGVTVAGNGRQINDSASAFAISGGSSYTFAHIVGELFDGWYAVT